MDGEAYNKNLQDIVNHGFITCALGLGQKLGLFDVLKDAKKSLTAAELADACNLRERYVEEWLGCMTASCVVMMDDEDKYYIPPDCKKSLPKVWYSPWVFLAGEIHTRTMQCFAKDGPLDDSCHSPEAGYGCYSEHIFFLDTYDERGVPNRGALRENLMHGGYDYLQLPDVFGEWLDMRIDHERVIEELLLPVKELDGKMNVILEIGMGEGALSRVISKHLPGSQYYGVEYHPKYVEKAKELAAKDKLGNVTYLLGDVENLSHEWTCKFDWVVLYDVLHDLPHPKAAMDEIRRVLKDDGFTSIVDPKIHSSHRDNLGDTNAGKFYAGSCFTCLPSSSSKESSAKLGIGWGEERKQTFLESNRWLVKDKRLICNQLAHYSFTCSKML